LRLLFLQAHRETEAHFTATGIPGGEEEEEEDLFIFNDTVVGPRAHAVKRSVAHATTVTSLRLF